MESLVRKLAEDALAASHQLATVTSESKDRFLIALADRLETERESLQRANQADLQAASAAGLSDPMVDRLRLTPGRFRAMVEGVRQVAALPDPVGRELARVVRPNGIVIRKVRVPIGTIGIIYESRPNVTVDCAALCLKSGNATLLRGGREAFSTNLALARTIGRSLQDAGLPPASVQVIPTTDREALRFLLKLDDLIHCLIPRGGEGLIRFVAENARMPVIKHYDGVCNVYVHADADPAMARAVVTNAKVSRPSVCNAAENLFLDRAGINLLPDIARDLIAAGVEIRADGEAAACLKQAGLPFNPATEDDFFTEYLGLILAVRAVDGLEEAIRSVNRYGSHHSDAIITRSPEVAARFQSAVDSATVYWNASTRFTDGFEFGLGAEIGISTDKLHARGPMGLEELTTYKYLIDGNGQIRP